MEVTAALARFISGTVYDRLPAAAIETAKTAILDTLGVALAGSKSEDSAICAELARAAAGTLETTVYGRGFQTTAIEAAFANGVASHACDFDHSYVLGGQPMAPIVPAVLALAEATHASGRQVIEAYVAGFEAASALLFAVRGSTSGGWHPNSVIGVFGATAACCRLLNLDEATTAQALGITTSLAGGLTANFGTMTKPLNVGAASRSGVLAARLAAAGYTANATAIEARNGFFDAFSGGKYDPGPLEGLGREYALDKYGLRLKPYPCGGLTHTAIYATIQLRNQHGFSAADVDRIVVEVPRGTYDTIAFLVPENVIQAKFCMPYLVARAFIDGTVTLQSFTEDAVRDVGVGDLLRRVEMRTDPAQDSAEGARPATVTMHLRDGRELALHERFPKGGSQLPMTPEEIEAKFRACAGVALPDEAVEAALRQLKQFEMMADVSSFAASLG